MRHIVTVLLDTDVSSIWTQCPATGKPVKLGYPCKCHGHMKRKVLAKHYGGFRRHENGLRASLDRRMKNNG